MECAIFFGMLFEIGAVLFALSLLKRSRWELFCETVDHFPENLKKRIAWRKRKILRAWGKLRTACLQCHVAGVKK